MELICFRDEIYLSPEFCLPAQTVNRPVCPCKVTDLMILKRTIYILSLVRPHILSRFIGSGRFPYKEACLDGKTRGGVSIERASLASIRCTILPFFLHGASTKHPKQIIYKRTLINFTFSIEFPFLLVWVLHVLRGYDLERKEGLEPWWNVCKN